jgi:hypothetical protein
MNIEPGIVTAIMALFGIGVIGIIQMLKVFLKLDGLGAKILAFVVSFGATAIYLLQIKTFTVLALVIYGLIVFGEASGLYKVFNKSNA